jgi:hypothetical protein
MFSFPSHREMIRIIKNYTGCNQMEQAQTIQMSVVVVVCKKWLQNLYFTLHMTSMFDVLASVM